MASSFYGGRPGASFIIKKRYSSVQSMIEEIGNNSTANQSIVGYGEYVLIDTSATSRLDYFNGTIFCREYGTITNIQNLEDFKSYNDDKEIAEEDKIKTIEGVRYIGNIRGPVGPAPKFEFLKYNDEKLEEISPIELSIENIGLIPSMDKEKNHEENTIKYKYISTPTGKNDETIVQMGIQIPYITIDEMLVEVAKAENTAPTMTLGQSANHLDNPFVWSGALTLPKSGYVSAIDFNKDSGELSYKTKEWNQAEKKFVESESNSISVLEYLPSGEFSINEKGHLIVPLYKQENNEKVVLDLGDPWNTYRSIFIAGQIVFENQPNSEDEIVKKLKEEFSDIDDGKVVSVVYKKGEQENYLYYAHSTEKGWFKIDNKVETSNFFKFGNENEHDDNYITSASESSLFFVDSTPSIQPEEGV